MQIFRFILVSAGLALGACTTSPVESEFGDSVRTMQAGQTLDPNKRVNPTDKPVIGADPYAIDAAVEAMRKDVPKREEVNQDVTINAGQRSR